MEAVQIIVATLAGAAMLLSLLSILRAFRVSQRVDQLEEAGVDAKLRIAFEKLEDEFETTKDQVHRQLGKIARLKAIAEQTRQAAPEELPPLPPGQIAPNAPAEPTPASMTYAQLYTILKPTVPS